MLQKLDVSNNKLLAGAAPHVFTANWPQLQDLHIQGNSLELGSSYLRYMSRVCSRLQSLRITISSIKDIANESTTTDISAIVAFEEALLVASSSLVLRTSEVTTRI